LKVKSNYETKYNKFIVNVDHKESVVRVFDKYYKTGNSLKNNLLEMDNSRGRLACHIIIIITSPLVSFLVEDEFNEFGFIMNHIHK
jgi:hypothetical protein